jgi:hypothetical protein
MKRLRISGLVILAKRVRQELAGPVAPERLAQIRRDVADAVRTIEQLLRDTRTRTQSLPAPSRKAYQFLKSLDLDAVVPAESGSAGRFPPESVSFRGLTRHFDGLLDQLARDTQEPDETYEIIRSDSESIEREIQDQKIRPEQLKRQAREIRGWLAYFSQREHFDAYRAAVRRAEPAFRAASPWAAKDSVEVLVHFRPMSGMYHISAYSGRALVQLPTPALCFNEKVLQAVARIAFKKGGDRQAVHDAGSAPYQKIAWALEQREGIVTQARGVHHDLDASFDRVNKEYFHGAMPRPHLVWSRTFATRKFGHYEPAHDTIMVSMVLDRETVPEYAVDLIVYHELLHKQLGLTWKNNRLAAHTPELKKRERAFRQYEQAKAVLRKLASER